MNQVYFLMLKRFIFTKNHSRFSSLFENEDVFPLPQTPPPLPCLPPLPVEEVQVGKDEHPLQVATGHTAGLDRDSADKTVGIMDEK